MKPEDLLGLLGEDSVDYSFVKLGFATGTPVVSCDAKHRTLGFEGAGQACTEEKAKELAQTGLKRLIMTHCSVHDWSAIVLAEAFCQAQEELKESYGGDAAIAENPSNYMIGVCQRLVDDGFAPGDSQVIAGACKTCGMLCEEGSEYCEDGCGLKL